MPEPLPVEQQEEPIVAISTPGGEGAIAMLRLSGRGCIELIDRIFLPSSGAPLQKTPHAARRVGHILQSEDSKERIDHVVVTPLRSPSTFTGEEMVELCCHGGLLVTRRVLQACLAAGARVAEPGEFSRRSFANGKMDLTQAEAIMDLIGARTDQALKAANEQLEGRLGKRIHALHEQLMEVIVHVEAYIDFPEEGIDPETGESLLLRMKELERGFDQLLATAEQGRILREGVRTVIVGEPNVGKSSLLNFLTGFDRAIVSQTPGTTRDSIEELLNLDGLLVRLIDTAGLRESTDEIENEGMRRTEKMMQSADLILLVIDSSHPPTEWYERIKGNEAARTVLVLNKADLPEHEAWAKAVGPRVSCTSETGSDELLSAIRKLLEEHGALASGAEVAINARHRQALEHARSSIIQARDAFENGLAPDLVAIDLRATLNHLGEVVGRTDVEDLLGMIFSRFCIGK